MDKPRTIVLAVITWKQAGGLEAVIFDIAATFANMNWRVVVLSAFDDEITEHIDGVNVVNLYPRSRWLRSLWRRVFWRPVLAWRVRKELIDGGLLIIGHAHLLPLLDFLSGCSKVRRWAWIYGLEVWGREARRWASRLNKLDRIVSISSFSVNQVTRAGVTTSIDIVQPCVDTMQFIPASSPERVRRNEILICGRMDSREQYKGHDVLFESLPMAEKLLNRDLILRIVGTGDDLGRLRTKAEQLRLDKKVIFTGRLSVTELVEAYQHCGVFCMPSFVEQRAHGYWAGEGFGIVYIEAAACGRPIIASADGGAPETVLAGETGVLVDPRSPDAVARAIAYILRDPVRADEMGKRGRQMVIQKFSYDVFSRKLRELIVKDALAER